MEFSYEEHVRHFYRSYAQRLGFGISKISCKNGDDGKQNYFSLTCSKNGRTKSTAKHPYYRRPSTKTDCKAKINVAIMNGGIYVITHVYLDHNHAFSPRKSRHVMRSKVLDSNVKRRLELTDKTGTTLRESSFLVESGGCVNLTFDKENFSEAQSFRLKIERLGP
ncbi:hypothetical protein ACH5RR_007565 [Cinchona calisaya]|uniref:FAR1 domain-containing protein n=1 Tax=Cinchona calisaya TaxID=153742 RepID=A0ABD3AS49_9GENT